MPGIKSLCILWYALRAVCGNGKYPFFIRSQTVKSKDDWEYDEEALIIPGEGGIGEIYHYVNEKYAIHQRVYRIHFTTEIVNVKFAFYYFSSCFKAFICSLFSLFSLSKIPTSSMSSS